MTRKVRSQPSADRGRGKEVPRPKMPEPDDFTMIYDGKDMYLAADKDRKAKQRKYMDFSGTRLASLGWVGLDYNRVHRPRVKRLRQLPRTLASR